MKRYLHIDPLTLTDDEYCETFTALQWLMSKENPEVKKNKQ